MGPSLWAVTRESGVVPRGALGTEPSRVPPSPAQPCPAGPGPPAPSGLDARRSLRGCWCCGHPPRKSRPQRAGRFPAGDRSGDAGSPRGSGRAGGAGAGAAPRFVGAAKTEKRGHASVCRARPEAAEPLASPETTTPGPRRVDHQQLMGSASPAPGLLRASVRPRSIATSSPTARAGYRDSSREGRRRLAPVRRPQGRRGEGRSWAARSRRILPAPLPTASAVRRKKERGHQCPGLPPSTPSLMPRE